MATHKHWSSNADTTPAPVTETAIPAAVVAEPVHVWTAVYEDRDNGDTTVRVYPTQEDCEAWRISLAKRDYDDWDDEEDDEFNADTYFDGDHGVYFSTNRHEVKPFVG